MTDNTTYKGPDDAVFIVEAVCDNCGATKRHGFKQGTTVEQKDDRVRVNACNMLGCTNECGRCGQLGCTVCDLTEHLKVSDRYPLADN